MILIGPVQLGRQVEEPLGINSNKYLKKNQFLDLFYAPHRLSRFPKVAPCHPALPPAGSTKEVAPLTPSV